MNILIPIMNLLLLVIIRMSTWSAALANLILVLTRLISLRCMVLRLRITCRKLVLRVLLKVSVVLVCVLVRVLIQMVRLLRRTWDRILALLTKVRRMVVVMIRIRLVRLVLFLGLLNIAICLLV